MVSMLCDALQCSAKCPSAQSSTMPLNLKESAKKMALVLFKCMLFVLSMSIGAKHTDFSMISRVAILPM